MQPLSWSEYLPNLELKKILQYGALHPILLSDAPFFKLKSYCGEYLQEEVQAEGLVRNYPALTIFL